MLNKLFILNIASILADADNILDDITRGFSPQALGWMKENFEQHLGDLLNAGEKVEISLVVDANNVIRAIIQYAKGKSSLLFKLANNPIFTLYAPPEVEKEVLAALKGKKNIDLAKAHEGWARLKTILKLDSIKNREALLAAKSIMGRRDPKDVAYVALYLQIGATAVMTDDRHFDVPAISRTNIEQVGEMVARIHRGILSFVFLHDLAPITLKAIYNLLAVALKCIFDFLKVLYQLISGIASGAVSGLVETIANLPSWMKAILLGILAGVGVALILDEKLRNNAVNAIKSAWNAIKPQVEALIKWIEENSGAIMEKLMGLAPHVEAATMVVMKLVDNIGRVVGETRLAAARVSASAS